MAEKITVEIDFETSPDSAKKIESSAKKAGQKAGEAAGASFAKGFGAVAAAAAGIFALGKAFKTTIDASIKQQEAVNQLSASLSRLGESARLPELENFASALQRQTTVGDEVILQQLSIAQSYGATADQAKNIIKASLDLAAAQGIDLNSAVQRVSKTLGGYAGELGEILPELKGLTQEQLQAGAAADLIAGKFAGAAAAQTKTFSGGLQQLSNNFGDVLEKIGDVVTKSPVLIGFINTLSQRVVQFGDTFSKAFNEFSLSATLEQLRAFAVSYQRFVVDPVIKTVKVIDVLKNGFSTGFDFIILAAARFSEKLGALLSAIGVTDLGEQLKETSAQIGDAVQASFEKTSIATQEAIGSLFSQESAEQINLFFDGLQEKLAQTEEAFNRYGESAVNANTLVASSTSKSAESVAIAAKDINGVVKGSLVKSLTVVGQSIGQAFANAGTTVGDFGKAIIGILGDLAIQIGQIIIATALTVEVFKKSILAAPLAAVAAGIGLIALGTAVKALAGSSSAAPSVNTNGTTTLAPSGATAGENVESGELATSDRRESQTVQIVVQGDVLDSDQTGLRILDILNENFDRNNGTLTNVSIA